MINFYYAKFDSPAGESIIASVSDQICWLSFNDDSSRFRTFIESYIDNVASSKIKRNFKRFKEHYPPFARMIVSKEVSIIEDKSKLLSALNMVQGYFDGKKEDFKSLKLVYLMGSPFQQRVWDELRNIPYGELKSYSDIAKNIGSAKAFRAVGSANGKNMIPLIIPCHRVIKADGSIGGYTGGLDIKRKLLEIENIKL